MLIWTPKMDRHLRKGPPVDSVLNDFD